MYERTVENIANATIKHLTSSTFGRMDVEPNSPIYVPENVWFVRLFQSCTKLYNSKSARPLQHASIPSSFSLSLNFSPSLFMLLPSTQQNRHTKFPSACALSPQVNYCYITCNAL